jgi:hypothetical protein
MKNYSVVDNFLNQNEFQTIKEKITYGGIPWYFSSNISGHKDDNDVYFASTIYDHMSNTSSEFLNVVLPVIAKIQPTILIRVKANLYPNSGKQVHHAPHRDYTFSHQGAIFYINENNGPTVLDDGTEILPKENRILFFDPSELHHSVSCTDQSIRLNLNFNYLKFY